MFPRRFRRHVAGLPLLVHSMGKVGSYSIYVSLQKAMQRASLDGRILHTHQLNRRTIVSFVAKLGHTHGHIKHAIDFLETDIDGRLKIITPVRDPLSRNISAFFENLSLYGFAEDAAGAPAHALTHAFLKKYPHHLPVTWFGTQVCEVFGIDVFADPLDFSSGGHVSPGSNADILLLRLEDPLVMRQDAIRRFVGLKSFEMETLNVAEEKHYAAPYRRFRDEFQPDADFLDVIYGSKFATHFYSSEELANMRRRWTR